MDDEDPEKRRLRQLAETAGSLAPSRIGAWTTPGFVAGESWSEMPWLGRLAFVILFVMLAGFLVLFVAAFLRAGRLGAAVVVVAFPALMLGVFAIRHVRGRRSARGGDGDDADHEGSESARSRSVRAAPVIRPGECRAETQLRSPGGAYGYILDIASLSLIHVVFAGGGGPGRGGSPATELAFAVVAAVIVAVVVSAMVRRRRGR